MEPKSQNPWKVAFITAVFTSILMYSVPRFGDYILPREKETINIGVVEDTIRFIDTSKEIKPKIIYRGGTVTLDGKKISIEQLVKELNKTYKINSKNRDSIRTYKKLYERFQDKFYNKSDSLYVLKDILNQINKDYQISYTFKINKNNSYTLSKPNNKRIDSALILYKLYGDRLRINGNNEWYVLSEKEYKRYLRSLE